MQDITVDLKFTLMDEFLWNYRAKCINVVDGDTLDLFIDLGLRTYKIARVRVLDLDTPEIYSVKKGSQEYIRGKAAKEALEKLILGREMVIETKKDKTGKFGRLLANIWVPEKDDLINVTLAMIEMGHGEAYE